MINLSNCSKNGLEMACFPILDDDSLAHGIFGRRGGVSRAPFDSLNVSFGVGDDPESVRMNRARLKRALAITTLVSARQVHGDRVLLVDAGQNGDFEADGYDALITKGSAGLMIQQADCQAVIIHDPAGPALGLLHAGWRGSVAGIVGATIRAMTANFDSRPENLRAAISPSLGPCCGEFVNYRRELPAWMHRFQVRPNYFNFPAITVHQLLEAGLQQENIDESRICTKCDPAYFSYRRSGITGRFATVAALRDQILSAAAT